MSIMATTLLETKITLRKLSKYQIKNKMDNKSKLCKTVFIKILNNSNSLLKTWDTNNQMILI